MITAVLATNVIVSGIISDRGAPARIMDLWRQGTIELVTCKETLEELNRVLSSHRLAKYHQMKKSEIDRLVVLLKKGSRFVVCQHEENISIEDPDDRVFIECALSAKADCIVSGDRHLLDVKEYRGVRILSPDEFIDLVSSTQ